jgi:hypothetical protein
MRTFTCTLLLAVLVITTAAYARPVYLKDGGMIQAKSVWRTKGMVHVLVNRDSLVDFHNSELDMKRTFPVRKKPAPPKPSEGAIHTPQAPAAVPPGSAVPAKPEGKRGFSLPTVGLPQKSPPSLGGKEEGAIRKQKREMSERLGE